MVFKKIPSHSLAKEMIFCWWMDDKLKYAPSWHIPHSFHERRRLCQENGKFFEGWCDSGKRGKRQRGKATNLVILCHGNLIGISTHFSRPVDASIVPGWAPHLLPVPRLLLRTPHTTPQENILKLGTSTVQKFRLVDKKKFTEKFSFCTLFYGISLWAPLEIPWEPWLWGFCPEDLLTNSPIRETSPMVRKKRHEEG